MFSITCAQKMAKIETLPSELEAWEQSRARESSKIERRRNLQLRSEAKYALGYGPAGRVPAYVQAQVSSLDRSPLSRPVFSPGRHTPPSGSRRRPRSAESTDRTCGVVAAARAMKPSRPTTASGHSSSNADHSQQQQTGAGGSASSPFLLGKPMARSATAVVSRTRILSGGRVRPSTAPCELLRGRRRRYELSARRSRKGDEEREEAAAEAAAAEETQLIEKLARLSGAHQRSEFPTVTSLKTAVAVKALQAQLRECRAIGRSKKNRMPEGCDGGDKGKRAVSAPISRNSHHQQLAADSADGTPVAPRVCSTKNGLQRRGNRDRQLKPWDNRSPFVKENVPISTANGATDRPTSPAAPSLRNLTRHDPVFGCLEASPSTQSSPSSPSRSTHFLSRPENTPSSTPTGGPNNHQDGAARFLACSPSDGGPADSGAAAGTSAAEGAHAARETQVQACFRRLTVGALIELNHLRNPPRPVLAVLAGLGCLLGWKQQGRNLSKNRNRNKGLHHHRRPPPPPPPRSLLGNAYVLRDVLESVRPRKIPSRRLSALTQILDGPEAAPAKVRSASASASVLLEWLLSVVACARSDGADGA